MPRLPVLLAFATLESNGDMALYTDPRKLPNEFSQNVGHGDTVKALEELKEALTVLGEAGSNILADPLTANAWSQLRCLESGAKLISGTDPVLLPKAQKNEVELNGMRNCHIRDGCAVSRYLAWIDREVTAGELHDEAQLANKLEHFRRELSNIQDLSFDTISAAGANGAMCHYNHMNGTPALLEMNNL